MGTPALGSTAAARSRTAKRYRFNRTADQPKPIATGRDREPAAGDACGWARTMGVVLADHADRRDEKRCAPDPPSRSGRSRRDEGGGGGGGGTKIDVAANRGRGARLRIIFARCINAESRSHGMRGWPLRILAWRAVCSSGSQLPGTEQLMYRSAGVSGHRVGERNVVANDPANGS